MIACVNWYNPLIWLYLKCFLHDLELACDESALKNAPDESIKRRYATALLNAEQGKLPLASAFGGANTRERIVRVLSYRRLTAFSAVCFALFVCVLAAALLTNAA